MEETKERLSKDSRPHCENAKCTRAIKYFCLSHKSVVCNTCYTALHLRCCTNLIANQEDVQEAINYVKKLLNMIMSNSELFKIHKYIKDFELDIKRYADVLHSIEQKFMKAVKKDKFTEFDTIRKSVEQCIILSEATNEDDIHIKNQTHDTNSEHFKKSQEKLVKEMEDVKQRELDEKLREERAKLVEEFKVRIKQMESEIEEQAKINQEKEEELKSEIEKYNQINNKITNLESLSLKYNLTDSVQKSYFNDLEFEKCRLPNIKRIRLESIPKEDAILNSFLLNCSPDQLQMFCFNRVESKKHNVERVMADFYVDALSKALKAVSKEVSIENLLLTESNLEQIVKASFNSEKLIFKSCKISFSATLDFDTTSDYKTESLSFENCEYFGSINEKSTPENIVEAIGKCGLKDKLETLTLKGGNIEIDKVQKIYKDQGLKMNLLLDYKRASIKGNPFAN